MNAFWGKKSSLREQYFFLVHFKVFKNSYLKDEGVRKVSKKCNEFSDRPKPVFEPRPKPRPKHTCHYTETETEPIPKLSKLKVLIG